MFEGLPLSLLEAMASGLVPIGLRAPGTLSVIQNGFNGLVVKNSKKELFNSILLLLTNVEKRKI